MQRMLFWILFLVIVGTSINISVSSSSTDYNNLYQTSGGQPAGSTTSSGSSGAPVLTVYIIVDGPGTGIPLYTTTDPVTGMITTSPENNKGIKAEGHIGGIGVGEGMNCPGPLGHYHGTLNSQADPDTKNCGWGHVAEYKNVSGNLQDIAASIASESRIIVSIEKEPPDYKKARIDTGTAISSLNDIRDHVRDPDLTTIGKGKAKAIDNKLGKAVKEDKSIIDKLEPLPNKRDINIDTAITLHLNKALMVKQDAFMLLNDAEAMAAAMANAMGE